MLKQWIMPLAAAGAAPRTRGKGRGRHDFLLDRAKRLTAWQKRFSTILRVIREMLFSLKSRELFVRMFVFIAWCRCAMLRPEATGRSHPQARSNFRDH